MNRRIAEWLAGFDWLIIRLGVCWLKAHGLYPLPLACWTVLGQLIQTVQDEQQLQQ